MITMLLLVLAFEARIANTTPDLIFSDNFDDGDISDWIVTTTDEALFDVSTDTSVTSPYSIHMESLSNSMAMGVSPPYDLVVTRDYDVSLYFLIPHTDNHWFEVFNNHQIYLIIDYNDDLKYYNGTHTHLIAELNTDQWYHIEIKVHSSSLNSYDVYVDDVFKKTCPIWIHGALEDKFRIGDRADGSTDKGEAYWDSIRIYQSSLIHDVAVTDVTVSKNVVGQGCFVNLTVTVENHGDFTENLNITAYANASTINSRIQPLESQSSETVTFIWNTTGFAKSNYTISAYAEPVQGETYTLDNNFTDSWIMITIVGDITGPDGWPDGKCDMRDIGLIARNFGLSVPPAPANCDITGSTAGVPDGKVDMRDIGTVARHFGETDP